MQVRINQIMELLPHRYPFLLVDRVEEIIDTDELKVQPEFQNGDRKLVYLTSIDNAKFRKPVKPGDQLRTTARLKRRRGNMGKFEFVAKVDDEIVAEAEMGFVIASGLTLEAE